MVEQVGVAEDNFLGCEGELAVLGVVEGAVDGAAGDGAAGEEDAGVCVLGGGGEVSIEGVRTGLWGAWYCCPAKLDLDARWLLLLLC